MSKRKTKRPRIHEDRCLADPMYALFLFPQRAVEDEYGNQVTFLDRCLRTALEIRARRYGDPLEKDRCVAHITSLLTSLEDDQVKLFFFLFSLHWEARPLADQIARMYDTSEGAGLFGQQSEAHFRRFVNETLPPLVEETLNCAYNRHNVAWVVRNFCQRAMFEYIIGPL